MRFINKIAAAGVAVVAAFAVVTALLVLSGPSPVKRAEAAAIYVTPSSTSTVADGTNTVNYVVTMTLDSGYLTAGTMTATTVLGNWRDSGTKTTSYQCLALGACSSGVTLVLDVGTTKGTNTVVVSGSGLVATDNTAEFTVAVSSGNPTSIAVTGGARHAALSSGAIGYTSPTLKNTLTITVTDTNGLGVNSRTLLVTTDKGGLLSSGTCASTSTAKSVTVGPTATTSTGTAGRTSVVFCPSRTAGQTGDATITITDSVIVAVSAETTATSVKEPVSAGITITAPDSLDRGASGSVSVTANDANGVPVARNHTITITANAGVDTGTGSCVLTPSGALVFSPLDSGTVSTTLSVVGPVTNCLLTATVTGGTGPTTAAVATALVEVNDPDEVVVEAAAAGVSGGDPVAAGGNGFRSVDGASNVGDVADAACANGDPLSLSVPQDDGSFDKYYPATPIISDLESSDALADGSVIHATCNA